MELRAGATVAIRIARLAAAAAVGAAGLGYMSQKEWLDTVNTGLWIAVVVLLEYEVRCPRAVAMHPAAFRLAVAALYTGLAGLILAWAWRGAWIDAYDAMLWLIAFATIEIDVMRARRDVTA